MLSGAEQASQATGPCQSTETKTTLGCEHMNNKLAVVKRMVSVLHQAYTHEMQLVRALFEEHLPDSAVKSWADKHRGCCKLADETELRLFNECSTLAPELASAHVARSCVSLN